MASCGGKKEEDPEPGRSTELELIIVNELGERQSGATVSIYKTSDDYSYEKNSVGSKTTDSDGKVLFSNLERIVYYFDVKKETLDNYWGTYKTVAPLTSNQTTTMTILVK